MSELLVNQVQKGPRVDITGKLPHYLRQTRRAVEGVFFDGTVVENPLGVLLGGQHSKYERLVSGLYFISRFMPSLVITNLEKEYGYSQGKMPFDPNAYLLKEKIGSGGVNDVFLLNAQESGFPSYVLKVNSASGGRDTEELVQIAREQKAEYGKIASAYEAISGLVPQEDHFIIHGPRAGKPVCVVLQVFVGKDIRDVFEDISRDEFVCLLGKNDSLAGQLADFITATETNPALIENELDLLGRDNLVVVGNKGEERLIFLDPHFRSVKSRSPETRNEIKERFNYLKEVSESSQL